MAQTYAPNPLAEGRSRAGRAGRLFALLILFLLLFPALAACSRGEGEAIRIADYGDEGARFARKLAASCPQRYPYSSQEAAAADLIMEELRRYGYQPEKQTFSITDEEGGRHTSANIVARLEGQGFRPTRKPDDTQDESATGEWTDRIMVIGAHYDTPASLRSDDESAEEGDAGEIGGKPNGIHHNASGVAAVLTAARILREEVPGYDVVFVFFGAGTDDYRGAAHYLSALSAEERRRIDVMVNIGPIFAGDKVYAHAGQNSVRSGGYKDYNKRCKLYQMTDIFFEYQLNSRNRYAIYTNQASFFVTLDSGAEAVFREWTTKLSDHTPFDRAGIPIVFVESGEYRVKKVDEVAVESRNPFFQDTGGIISGTRFDETRILETLFREMDEQAAGQTIPAIEHEDELPGEEIGLEPEADGDRRPVPRLVMRINNTAFVLVQLTRKGPLNFEFND